MTIISYNELQNCGMEHLPEFSKALQCTPDDILTAIGQNSSNNTQKDIIFGFIRTLHQIRHEKKNYFIFKRRSNGVHDCDCIYELIDDTNVQFFLKICTNFQKINIGRTRIGGVQIVDLKIEEREYIEGHPTGMWMTPADLELLKQIPAGGPRPFFKKIELNPFPEINKECSGFFSADETKMKELFSFPISMEEKNYLAYMGEDFCLEAGRGTKWYISGNYWNELKRLFIYNTAGKDLDERK